MERLVGLVIFLAKRNLAFRGSNKILSSPPIGHFLELFELLTKRDPVLNELQNKTIPHISKQRHFSADIRNKLINLNAREAEKVLLTQLKQAKYFAVNLDCTPDISHREQSTVILRFVQCNGKSDANVKEGFLGCLRVHDSTGKCLLNVFLKQSEELEQNLSYCSGHCYDNGANMKEKKLGSKLDFCKLIEKRCMFHVLYIF